MHNLPQMLSLTAPIFILIGLGYITVKTGWFAKANSRGLSWFVGNIGVPAAIFNALISRPFIEVFRADYLVIYGAASLFAFCCLFFTAKFRGKNLTEATFYGVGASMSNSIMIGYPLAIQIFGEAAIIPFALTLIVENLLMLPLALALAVSGQSQTSSFFKAFLQSLPQLVKNPILIAIVLGIVAGSIGFELPSVLNKVSGMLASTVAAVALFAVGTALVGVKLKGMMTDISLIMVGKLLIHPLAVIVMISLMPPMPETYQAIAVLIASAPMFTIYAVLGERFSLGEFCSAALVPTTIASFITINAFLLL